MSDPDGHAEGGFAATDALVALLILSTTLALALAGVTTARHLSEGATQTSQAARLAELLVIRQRGNLDADTGRTGRFAWRVDRHPLAGRAQLCAKDLMLKSLRDGRTYHFTTAGECG